MTGRHVLVARLDNAGDVLLAGPAVRAVAAGADRVTLLCGSEGRAAGLLLPGVDDVVTYDAAWVAFDAPAVDRAATERFVDHLAGLGIDRAFVLTSFHQSPLPLALLLRLAGVPEIAATCVDYPGRLLDLRHPVIDEAHEVEQALALVSALGHHLPTNDDGRLQVRSDRLPLADEVRPFSEPYVVVHPGASVPARALDVEMAAAVVDVLAARGWRVAVTGSPAEHPLTAEVAGRAPDTADLGGALDFAGLATVLAEADAVVVGNTGPAHLAAAVGTPVVSIFAPVVPVHRWRPWRVPSVVLGDHHIGCAGCRARTCPYEEQPCLADVSADVVADAVRALAGEPRRLEVPA